jgi:hypothetical protein
MGVINGSSGREYVARKVIDGSGIYAEISLKPVFFRRHSRVFLAGIQTG